MFSKLFGAFAILVGVLWLVWPGLLKGWLARKAGWQIFWAVFGLLALFLFRESKALGFAGIFVILVVFWLLMSRARRGIRAALGTVPETAYRVAAILQIGLGIALVIK